MGKGRDGESNENELGWAGKKELKLEGKREIFEGRNRAEWLLKDIGFNGVERIKKIIHVQGGKFRDPNEKDFVVVFFIAI